MRHSACLISVKLLTTAVSSDILSAAILAREHQSETRADQSTGSSGVQRPSGCLTIIAPHERQLRNPRPQCCSATSSRGRQAATTCERLRNRQLERPAVCSAPPSCIARYQVNAGPSALEALHQHQLNGG